MKKEEDRDERKKGQQEVQTLTNSYLMIDPNKSNGVLPRLYNYTDYNAFSRPTEDIDVSTGSITQSVTSIPSPIVGKYIHLPDGSVTLPGLGWASDTASGRYKIGTSNFGESVAGDLKYDWNTTRLRLDTGFSLDITDMTSGSVLFAGSGGRVSQNNSFFFWDASNARLGVGCNDPWVRLELRHSSTSQLALSTNADNGYFFTAGGAGLNIQMYNNLGLPANMNLLGDDDGENTALRVRNSSSVAGSMASIQVHVEAGTGDPVFLWDVSFATAYTAGIDNSDSDKWKLSKGETLGTTDLIAITSGGYTTFTPLAASSGTSHGFTVTGPINTAGANGLFRLTNGASTGQTLSTEINFVKFDLSSTVTWAAGALANERAFQILAPTLAFSSASTVTNAATVYIDRAPVAGTNATITNAYALWVDDGAVRIDGALTVGSFAISGLTQGSVLFAGASGAISQDNANFYWDDSLNALGIGDVPFDGIRLRISGTITPSAGNYAAGVYVDTTINAAAGEIAFGSDFGCTINEASSGNHDELGAAFYSASFIGAAGTTSITSILRISERGTIGTKNYSFYSTANDSSTDPMAHIEQQGSGDCAIRLQMTTATPRSYILGIDATDDVFKIAYNSSDAVLGANDYFSVGADGETIVTKWFQVGTATDPAAQGDFVAGLTGAARMFYDQSVPTLALYNSSGTVVNLLSGVAATATVWNEQGADIDFRIEGDTAANLFFVDASTDFIGINTSGPDRRLDVLDASNPQVRLTYTDGSVYTDLKTDSAGTFTITPTGNRIYTTSTIESQGVILPIQSLDQTTGPVAVRLKNTGGDFYFGIESNTANNFFTGSLAAYDAAFYTSTPFNVILSGTSRFYVNTGEVVVNEPGNDIDFRVETDADTHALFVDAGVGSVRAGKPSLATNATDGFLYVPACGGTPTGAATAVTGMIPIVVDSTNNKLYFYSGGAWRDAGP